jgi:hypothetical protein
MAHLRFAVFVVFVVFPVFKIVFVSDTASAIGYALLKAFVGLTQEDKVVGS